MMGRRDGYEMNITYLRSTVDYLQIMQMVHLVIVEMTNQPL